MLSSKIELGIFPVIFVFFVNCDWQFYHHHLSIIKNPSRLIDCSIHLDNQKNCRSFWIGRLWTSVESVSGFMAVEISDGFTDILSEDEFQNCEKLHYSLSNTIKFCLYKPCSCGKRKRDTSRYQTLHIFLFSYFCEFLDIIRFCCDLEIFKKNNSHVCHGVDL